MARVVSRGGAIRYNAGEQNEPFCSPFIGEVNGFVWRSKTKPCNSRIMLFDQNGIRKYLTASERRAFMEAAKQAPPKVETFCLTLTYTGARISEALALTPMRVDVASQAVIIETLKRRKRGVFRAVPVPSDFIARLESAHCISEAQVELDRNALRLWQWGRTTAWTRVKEVMRTAGITSSTAMPKALRHAFGVGGVADAMVPLNVMQKWLGHARIETTAIYADALGAEERALAARMWQQG